MIVHTNIETFGSLEIFKKRDLTLDVAAQELPGIYWCDIKHFPTYAQGIGPFPSIHQALEHYIISKKQLRAAGPTMPQLVRPEPPLVDPTVKFEGKLIQVDFVNRKRIS